MHQPHRPRARTPLAARAALPTALLALAGACGDPASAPGARAPDGDAPVAARAPAAQPAGQKIPGRWIVVLRDGVRASRPRAGAALDAAAEAREAAVAVAGRHRAQITGVYAHALRGFAAAMSDADAAALRADPEVALVEQDQIVTIDAVQTGATWGIDRIDQRNRPLSGSYSYTATGRGVNVYVIDTGILTGHAQFGGRAANVYDGVGGNGQDCNGHGTHVSGTVGGSTYGVAKEANLRGVRVFTCSGSSANSTIIAGIDWVRANHVKPAVANLSLGGGYSAATNTAVRSLAAAGVYTVVAAGNSGRSACNYSPASEPTVMTVAASTSSDARASYSNYGSCVDVYAPGSSITSAWYTSPTATNTISGTSMASPHVAGVAALYKSALGDASQATIDGWITSNATPNVITSNRRGTPNRLLFKSTL